MHTYCFLPSHRVHKKPLFTESNWPTRPFTADNKDQTTDRLNNQQSDSPPDASEMAFESLIPSLICFETNGKWSGISCGFMNPYVSKEEFVRGLTWPFFRCYRQRGHMHKAGGSNSTVARGREARRLLKNQLASSLYFATV